MIIAETPAAYRFVTQPDHARLAGAFAEHWGNHLVERPAPFASVVAAAHVHDDGWFAYDSRPRLGDDGTPVGFTELPAATWTELYDRGIDQATDLDRYAGLLVSLHGTGLRRRRYGLSPSWPETPAAFRAFVDRQERRQRELLDDLAEGEDDDRVSALDDGLLAALHEAGTAPETTSSRLWANYRLLQAWDTLSLACCTTVSPPGRDAIDRVPTRRTGAEASLSLAASDDGTVVVDPYPFDVEPLPVGVPTRTVEKASFETARELVEAYYAAGRGHVEIQFRPPG